LLLLLLQEARKSEAPIAQIAVVVLNWLFHFVFFFNCLKLLVEVNHFELIAALVTTRSPSSMPLRMLV
jgi:hypothetical protein